MKEGRKEGRTIQGRKEGEEGRETDQENVAALAFGRAVEVLGDVDAVLGLPVLAQLGAAAGAEDGAVLNAWCVGCR